jgi:hypothetical protein
MTGKINHTLNKRIGRVVILSAFAAVTLPAQGPVDISHQHSAHESSVPSKLVADVRSATKRFADVNAAVAAGYGPFLGCVSGPDQGAMGIHYVNSVLVGDGQLNVNFPEALIYEPTADGLHLVGVEYIVDAANWILNHNTPPVLEGQTFQFVPAPNRFGLPAFFELHVWAWRDNPNGAFVDWNTRVTCEGQ